MRVVGIIIVLVLIIIPVSVFSETGADPQNPEASEQSESVPEGFSVAVDLRLSANIAGIVPGLSAVIGIPLSFGSDSFSVIPLFGFQYFFDVWTDMHESFYIPLGLAAVYNPMNAGIEIIYYPPIGGEAGNHLLSSSIFSELDILEAERFSMHFDLSFGPAFVLAATDQSVLFRLNAALALRYTI